MKWFHRAPRPDIEAELQYITSTAAAAAAQHVTALHLTRQAEGQSARLKEKNRRNHFSEGMMQAFTGSKEKPC